MKLTGQQTLELKLNQVSQKQKQFRQGMWIKKKKKQLVRRSLTAKSKPNYLSWRNCAIYQGYNKKAKQRPKKLKTS